jgi:molecular chaperone DnaK
VPQVEVTFDIDATGILNVAAKDLATGREQKITITGASQLDKNDVDKMVKDAEAHATEDHKRREEAEIRNRADALVYSTEKNLKDLGDKVPSDMKVQVENALEATKAAIQAEDVERIRTTSQELEQTSYKLSEILYQQASAGAKTEAGPEQAPPGQAGGEEGEVIDAEFKKSE